MYSHAGYFPGSVAAAPGDVRAGFVRKVYTYFFFSVLAAIGAGAMVYQSPSLMRGMIALMWPLLIGWFVLSIVLRFAREQTTLNTVLLLIFGAVSGAMVAPILWYYNQAAPGVGLQAAILSGSVFGGLTWYAWFSRKDFSYLGGALMVGLIALIASGFLMFFLRSDLLILGRSLLGVAVFSGFVLYDTSRIMQRYPPSAVVPAACDLYIDLFGLFLHLLRLLAYAQRRN